MDEPTVAADPGGLTLAMVKSYHRTFPGFLAPCAPGKPLRFPAQARDGSPVPRTDVQAWLLQGKDAVS